MTNRIKLAIERVRRLDDLCKKLGENVISKEACKARSDHHKAVAELHKINVKEGFAVAMMLLFSSVAMAAAPTLESLNKDLELSIKKLDGIKSEINKNNGQSQKLVQDGLVVQGEIIYIQKLIAGYEEKV